MPRPVIVMADEMVDDRRVANLYVEFITEPESVSHTWAVVPVPRDDQLTRDVELACRALEAHADFAWSPQQVIDADQARARLRAAFQLDQGEAT